MKLQSLIQARYKCNTFQELAARVSAVVGQTDSQIITFKSLINRKQFIPAGNTLLAGVDPIRPNCCILEPINEYNFNTLAERCENLWRSRIGIGFDLSTAHDPVKILERLSEINASIKLGHRPQRGNMAVLKHDHPRINEFVRRKVAENRLYNFNLSVAITNPLSVDASLWEEMAIAAHARGDPGVVFLDRLQHITNATDDDLKIINERIGTVHTIVPCGEQGLFSSRAGSGKGGGEFCTLGSINLGCMDFWPMNTNNEISFDEKVFEEAVRQGVNFLDNTIDLVEVPDTEIYRIGMLTRRIGLGLMGWADALDLNGIKYGSEESYKLAHKIGSIFKKTAHDESSRLGQIKGPAPVLIGTGLSRRNMMITCCPPTGGITLLAGNRGFGVEPFFSEANALPSEVHVKMQLIWQSYMDNCVSKTVNLPNDCTPEDIKKVWINAANSGLKCITVYRDGSHIEQPIVNINSTSVEKRSTSSDCPRGVCDFQ